MKLAVWTGWECWTSDGAKTGQIDLEHSRAWVVLFLTIHFACKTEHSSDSSFLFISNADWTVIT